MDDYERPAYPKQLPACIVEDLERPLSEPNESAFMARRRIRHLDQVKSMAGEEFLHALNGKEGSVPWRAELLVEVWQGQAFYACADEVSHQGGKTGGGLRRHEIAAGGEKLAGLFEPLVTFDEVLKDVGEHDGVSVSALEVVNVTEFDGEASTVAVVGHSSAGFDAFIGEAAFYEEVAQNAPPGANLGDFLDAELVKDSGHGFEVALRDSVAPIAVGGDMFGGGVLFLIGFEEFVAGRLGDQLE